MKKKLIAVVTIALAALVLPAAGLAGAAESSSPKSTGAVGSPGHRISRALALHSAATAIGVEPKVLRNALADGRSVADVARAHHVGPQAVIDAVRTAADKRIDEAVANGKIDAARAKTIKDRLETRLTKLVDATLGPRARHRLAQSKVRHVRRHARRGALVVAARTIDVKPKELVSALRDGQSVADVARTKNVDPQAVIHAIVTAGDKKVDEAVTNGKIDASRAATIKERLTDRVTKLVNATRPARAAK